MTLKDVLEVLPSRRPLIVGSEQLYDPDAVIAVPPSPSPHSRVGTRKVAEAAGLHFTRRRPLIVGSELAILVYHLPLRSGRRPLIVGSEPHKYFVRCYPISRRPLIVGSELRLPENP